MLVKFNDRVVLKIFGESVDDILGFLQQVTSNDVIKNYDSLVYTLFLSGNGKFLFDGFIFHDNEFVYIDCFSYTKEQFISHIKKYKARLNIKIDETKYFVYQDFKEDNVLFNNKLFIFNDPRNLNLGKRIYSFHEIGNKDFENLNEYHQLRVELNISEGCYEMIQEQSFPIYFRMHEINAISLNKGCYLGQEPTNRLYRTGILRKRIVAFNLNEENFLLKKGDKLDNGIICSIFSGRFGFLMREKEDLNIDK